MRNGVYVPDRHATCGDSMILIGREENHRRYTSSLEEYVSKPPPMEGIMEMNAKRK